MAYELDYTLAKELQLSNDAFFYLTEEEEMLDDSNMDEALDIAAMFPNGYVVSSWEYVDSDLISATFIPYVQQQEFDGEIELFNNWFFQFKIINQYKAFGQFYNKNNGKKFDDGEWPIVVCCNGKKHRIHIQKPGRNDICEIPLD